MSSFLDALKAAPKTSQAKLNTVLMSFKPDGREIYIFLEGRDDPSFIRVNVQRVAEPKALSVQTIILENKKEVLNAYDYFEQRFPDNPRLMFFVDKDHDDLIGETRGTKTQRGLFVTQHYSIENYLVSETAIAAILTDCWGLDSSNRAIAIACEKFREFQEQYRLTFLPWMAWLLATRRSGKKTNINNIPDKILTVNQNYQIILNCQPDLLTYLAKVCGIKTQPDNTAIDSAIKELEALPTKVWLRGKQELWCLIAFINRLEQDAKAEKIKLKIRSQIHIDNIVEWLAPRLPCPLDLEDYLTTRLGNI